MKSIIKKLLELNTHIISSNQVNPLTRITSFLFLILLVFQNCSNGFQLTSRPPEKGTPPLPNEVSPGNSTNIPDTNNNPNNTDISSPSNSTSNSNDSTTTGNNSEGLGNSSGTHANSDTGVDKGPGSSGNSDTDSGTGNVDISPTHIKIFTQPQQTTTKKIDILFVRDTSGSMNGDHAPINSGIEYFIKNLPVGGSYRFGVLLAHGDRSVHSGRLFKNGTAQNYLTLENGFNHTEKMQVITQLKSRLSTEVTDSKTDGGEAGLYSLHRSLTDKDNDGSIILKKQFLREDAALAIVFIADENDICSYGSYPDGISPTYDVNKKEWPAYYHLCTINKPNTPALTWNWLSKNDFYQNHFKLTETIPVITPETIFKEIKTIKPNSQIVLAGVIYSHQITATHGEEEIGYGYKELIEMAGDIYGHFADLELVRNFRTGPQYTQHQLKHIGELAISSFSLQTEFSLTDAIRSGSANNEQSTQIQQAQQKITITQISIINAKTSAIKVLSSRSYVFDSQTNHLKIDTNEAGSFGDRIEVKYQLSKP